MRMDIERVLQVLMVGMLAAALASCAAAPGIERAPTATPSPAALPAGGTQAPATVSMEATATAALTAVAPAVSVTAAGLPAGPPQGLELVVFYSPL